MQDDLSEIWMEVAKQPDLTKIKVVLQRLAPENKYLLGKICHFLNKVYNNSEMNKMSSNNLGIVFGPAFTHSFKVHILDDSGEQDFTTKFQSMQTLNVLTAQLIEHSDEFFSDIEHPFLKGNAWPKIHRQLSLPLQKSIEEVLCIIQVPCDLKKVMIAYIIRVWYFLKTN